MSRFEGLLSDWLDDPGSPPDLEQDLADLVEADPRRLQRLCEHHHLHRACAAWFLHSSPPELAQKVQGDIAILRQRRRWTGWSLTVAALALIASAIGWWQATSLMVWGRVESSSAAARMLRDGQHHAITAGMVLAVGDELQAPAGLTLIDDHGAILQLQGLARLIDAPPDGARLHLRNGELDCRITLDATHPRWAVVTPHLTAQVTGTRFTLAVDADGTEVAVSEGSVQVRDAVSGAQRMLSTGEHGRFGDAKVTRMAGTTRPMPEPLCWWPCDEGSGRKVGDHGAHGREGRLVGSVDWAPGHSGSALRFTGSGLLRIDDHPLLDLQAGTIAMWIKPERPFAEQAALAPNLPIELFSKCAWDERRGFELVHPAQAAADQLGIRLCRPPNSVTGAYVAMPATLDWLHVAGTWGDGSIRVYLDGALLAESPDGPTADYGSDQHVNIGNYFHGLIDEVLLYDRPLRASEIATLCR